MQPKRGPHEPDCQASHDSINKLSAIVNHCDLLLEQTSGGSEIEKRIKTIRRIAQEGIAQMKEHQKEIGARTEQPDQKKAG